VKRTEDSLFLYIEACYNRRRRHSASGYLSPEAFEQLYHQALSHPYSHTGEHVRD
jgi:transposase InsO family protein